MVLGNGVGDGFQSMVLPVLGCATIKPLWPFPIGVNRSIIRVEYVITSYSIHYTKLYDNGKKPEDVRDRVPFDYLTPLFPFEKLNLFDAPENYSTRIMDLFTRNNFV